MSSDSNNHPIITLTFSVANLTRTTPDGEAAFGAAVNEAMRVALTGIAAAIADCPEYTTRNRNPSELITISMTARVHK